MVTSLSNHDSRMMRSHHVQQNPGLHTTLKPAVRSLNIEVKQYTCLLTELHNNNKGERVNNKNIANRKRKERKNLKRTERANETLEANKKHIKNLSNKELTNDQINLASKGLKFIPTPVTNLNLVRRQLLQDFNQFARRMRLQYIFYG